MNPFDLAKNLQSVQAKLNETQDRMRSISAVGCAGGDMVMIEMLGDFSVRSVKISPEAVDPDDIELLQDLILAAYTDAAAKIRESQQDVMGQMMGGMKMPPNLFGV